MSNTAEVTITDQNCRLLAEQFIEESGINISDYIFSKIGYDILTELDSNKELVVTKTVYFTKQIDNLDIYGNTIFYISIVNDGTISTVYSSSTDIENKYEVDEKNIVNLDEAIEKAKNLEGSIEFPEESDRIILEKVEVAYWEDSSPGSDNYTIQPVYLIKGTAYSDNNVVGEAQFIEAALE